MVLPRKLQAQQNKGLTEDEYSTGGIPLPDKVETQRRIGAHFLKDMSFKSQMSFSQVGKQKQRKIDLVAEKEVKQQCQRTGTEKSWQENDLTVLAADSDNNSFVPTTAP